jgi:uncharacterized SAM-binding protein YcdF (DUF218 family)
LQSRFAALLAVPRPDDPVARLELDIVSRSRLEAGDVEATVVVRRLLTVLVVLLALLTAVLLFEVQMLRPVDDQVEAPDVVVVLGGAGPERVELGVELSDRHGVPLVLSSSARDFGADRGLTCPPAVCILTDPETTAGEASAVAELAEEHGWERVVVATTRFHTARARMLFRQCFGDRVAVVGAERAGGHGPAVPTRTKELLGLLSGATFARAC